jgi:hypothetical protein
LGCPFLWESRCEDCVCFGITLKCNTQRAHTLGASALNVWVQFDSDYSDGDEASTLFFKVRTLIFCHNMDSYWILLILTSDALTVFYETDTIIRRSRPLLCLRCLEAFWVVCLVNHSLALRNYNGSHCSYSRRPARTSHICVLNQDSCQAHQEKRFVGIHANCLFLELTKITTLSTVSSLRWFATVP